MELVVKQQRASVSTWLRALFLSITLLYSGTVDLSHGHDGAAPSNNDLCAICAYGFGAGAATNTPLLQVQYFWGQSVKVPSVATRYVDHLFADLTLIRGPPALI